MKHLKILTIISAFFLTLAGCSQQQVAGDGSSQMATSQQVSGEGSSQVASSQQVSSQQNVADADVEKACEACNAPTVEAVENPPQAQQTIAKAVPAKKPVYQQRRHLPTVPSKKNASSTLVMSIQQALKDNGFNPGNVDGVMGSRSAAALHAFQKSNGLAIGDLNRATMQKLGLMQ